MADLFTSPVDVIKYEDLDAFRQAQPEEGERLDFKTTMEPRVIESIVGMHNTLGGLILVGIEEEEIQGVRSKRMKWPPRGVPASAVDALVSMCRAGYRGDYLPRYHPVQMPGRPQDHVLLIRVDRRRGRRALWHAQKGYLVRIGDQNVPVPPERARSLLLEGDEDSPAEHEITEWRMDVESIGGVPRLAAVVRYPQEARAFGTPEKTVLWRAVGRFFGQYHTLHREFTSTATRFSIPTDEADERVMVTFSVTGAAIITAIRPSGKFSWKWVIGEGLAMMECVQSQEVAEVYPAVSECEVMVGLAGWTAEDLDVTGLLRTGSFSGRRGQRPAVIYEPDPEDPITPWGVIRPFAERLLGDAGFLDYEKMLDLFESDGGVETFLTEYYRTTRKV